MSEIFTEQVTAIANIVLAAGAIVTGIFAILAFSKQSKEVADQAEMLSLQGQQLQEALDASRRSQAAGVTGWFAPSPDGRMGVWGTLVRNDSGLPVYEVRTSFHYIQEPTKGLPWTPISQGVSTERVRVLPSRSEQFIEIPADVRNQLPECSDEVYAAGITFTDAAGIRWERDPKGVLRLWS